MGLQRVGARLRRVAAKPLSVSFLMRYRRRWSARGRRTTPWARKGTSPINLEVFAKTTVDAGQFTRTAQCWMGLRQCGSRPANRDAVGDDEVRAAMMSALS
jgi:hypothetical protein